MMTVDRVALRRLYEGAEAPVIGEALLEAALAPIEAGAQEDERWEFVDRELLGANDQTRDVLSDVWDASDAEHLSPWLGEVRAQVTRAMRLSSVVHELRRGDDAATLAAFAAAVDAAAPWLSSWLAPHVAGAYAQVAGKTRSSRLIWWSYAHLAAPRPSTPCEKSSTARRLPMGLRTPRRRARR